MGIGIDIASIYSGHARTLIVLGLLATFLFFLFCRILDARRRSAKPAEASNSLAKKSEMPKTERIIAEFAASMASAGATSSLSESSVRYLCARFGVSAEIIGFPKHVLLSVSDENPVRNFTITQKLQPNPLDFHRIILLHRLAKETLREMYPLEVFWNKYREILCEKRLHPNLVLVLTGLANASCCKLFNGDAVSMGMVFWATECGFFLKNALHGKFGIDRRPSTIFAAFVSTVIGCAGYAFQLGDTPDIALATSVLYLVPGIPYINALSDLLNGAFLSCIRHTFNATILTICLSIGFSLGLISTNLHFF